MKLCFLSRSFQLSLPLFRDIRHHGHDAAGVYPAAEDSVNSAVGCLVLKTFTRRITQALYPPSYERFLVAVSIVAMLSEKAEKVRIVAAWLKQLTWHPVHVSEAVIAKDDIKIVVRVDKRTRHVVEGNVQLGFLLRHVLYGALALGDVGI